MMETEQPIDHYLTSYAPEPTTRTVKPVQQCAIRLYDGGIYLSLKLIGNDTTNYMSGWQGGMLHCVEELPNRRLYRSVRLLHINELPLRYIVAKLDGPPKT